MTIIKKDDLITSVADALQYISYYHSPDFVQAMAQAYEREESPAAKEAIAQILISSRMSAEGHRPICQDTGVVVIFADVGRDVRWDSDDDFEDILNEGVRQAYTNVDNILRASVVYPMVGQRLNTKDNTPAVIHTRLVGGAQIKFRIAAKGFGSENKTRFAVLNPSDSVADWVEQMVPTMGAGWCPPGMLGIGLGGTAEKAMLLAKESLLETIDIHELQARGPNDLIEELRLDIFQRVNALGIGAQGLGGLTTVLDVKIKQYASHAASLPVALIPNCAATRHVQFELDGSGPAQLVEPKLSDWPIITRAASAQTRRVNLDTLTRDEVATWKAGERLLLCGKLLTGRDAAHQRIRSLLESGQTLPEGVDFTNRMIYYVGPVKPVRDEVVGPAGPTTSTRMDKFTDMMLGETGLIAMVGKGERGAQAIESIVKHKAAYLMAVGGAAYLVSKAIRKSRVLAFEDLGMEAIHEFEVEDMPVMVAVDSTGESMHETGPKQWRTQIAGVPVTLA